MTSCLVLICTYYFSIRFTVSVRVLFYTTTSVLKCCGAAQGMALPGGAVCCETHKICCVGGVCTDNHFTVYNCIIESCNYNN